MQRRRQHVDRNDTMTLRAPQHRDRGDIVVEEGREQRRDQRQAHGQGEGAPAGELPCADRDEVVDPGLLGQVDEDHHPDEEADRVEVDRLDRLLLGEGADEEDNDRRAEEGHRRPVELFGGDDRKGDQEDCDCNSHWGLSGFGDESPTRAHGSSGVTIANVHPAVRPPRRSLPANLRMCREQASAA